jgi:glycosyltransferase involved in cell wall biosynthesis
MPPLVSIVLAVYNGEKYIEKSISSIINQTYPYFEILIGINGTVDNSKEIVSRFHDPRIRIFDYGNDKGKAITLNKLLKDARGEWVAIQDDDDIWMDDKLESQMKYVTDFDVIGTQIKYINDADEIIGEVVLETDDLVIKEKSLTGHNQIANTSGLVRKACIDKIAGWRTDIDGIEDYDFWLRLMRNNYKFINLKEVKVYHRLHSKSNFNTRQHDLSLILGDSKKKKPWHKIKRFFKL